MAKILEWDGKPLAEVLEGEYIPSIVLCDMVRTHNSQLNIWLREEKIPYKEGKNGNRDCKMVKVLPLSKMVTLLRNCGMAESKLEYLTAEGYSTEVNFSKKTSSKTKGAKAKGKPGRKPGSRGKPGPKPKSTPVSSSNPLNKYAEKSKKYGINLETYGEMYAEVIEDAVKVGMVALV